MKKVLITDPVAPKGLELLANRGLEVVDLAGAPVEEVLEAVGTVHGWIVRSGTRVDAEMLNRADQLQVVGRAGVGIDNIDLEAATLRGVVVMNTPDSNTISAAEHTMALIMALARNVHLGHGSLSQGRWDRKMFQGTELNGKVLGIVGLGRIGRRVMDYARALDMKVLGYDPYAPGDLLDSDELEIVDLEELLKRSDFVTLHVPRNEETANLINASRLKLMKSSARIINVARGGIVNEKDLAAALNKGTIAGAAIDVFSKEPPPDDHPLLGAKNILLTPHLGASTREAQEGVSTAICEQVAAHLTDGSMRGALNVPIADPAMIKKLEPYLDLTMNMGRMLCQLTTGSISAVGVTCSGTLTESYPISLAALSGLLSGILDTRLNFINVSAIADERGIAVTNSYDSGETGYANLVRIEVHTTEGEIAMAGSVFGHEHPRVVEIDGYHLELNPEGVMLFITNRDVPGVLGQIGTSLGASGINIGECLLSRERSIDNAYLVIKVDEKPARRDLDALLQLKGILSVRKVCL